jgi:V/A-type H+/Na+-transporting ATPase subunit A
MSQWWPVRQGRPYTRKLDPTTRSRPACASSTRSSRSPSAATPIIPGGFGTGKTVTQQSLAKWADVDVIVYVGCGERGNEMTEVLTEFPELEDPRNGAAHGPHRAGRQHVEHAGGRARGVHLRRHHARRVLPRHGLQRRDDGRLDLRWGEALREVSGRLEEMPGEEGYPAYLATRLARSTSAPARVGRSVPRRRPRRFGHDGRRRLARRRRHVRADDAELAARDGRVLGARHLACAPASLPRDLWTKSYTLFLGQVRGWYERTSLRTGTSSRPGDVVLQKETELQEIVQLVGPDALPESEKIILEVARMLREDFLQQFAFDDSRRLLPAGEGSTGSSRRSSRSTTRRPARSRGRVAAADPGPAAARRDRRLKTTPHEEAIERDPELFARDAEGNRRNRGVLADERRR